MRARAAQGWCGIMRGTASVAAAIYEVWATKHLGKATVGPRPGSGAQTGG